MTWFGLPPLAGLARLARALGVSCAGLFGLLIAYHEAPSLALDLATDWHPQLEESVPKWASGFHLAQFITYVLCFAMGLAAALVWMIVYQRFRARWLRAVLVALSAAALVAAAIDISGPLAKWTAGAALIMAVLVAAAGHPAPPPRARDARDRALRWLVVGVAEILATAWGTWLVVASRKPTWMTVVPTIALGLLVFRWAQQRRELERACLAGLPALLLPLLGLMRGPSRLWLVGAIALAVVIARMCRGWRAPDWMVAGASVAALVSLAAILIIPIGMRDLPSINYEGHEGQHLGWINSIFFWKLMGADAGLTYGPLREYLLALHCMIFGITVENVRVAHTLVNLAGCGVYIATLNSILPRRYDLTVALAYLAVYNSPLRAFADPDQYIALGWADALRTGLPILVLVGLARALSREQARARLRASTLALAPWGAGTGVALLYSQEFGLCALLSCLALIVAHFVLTSGIPASERFRAGLRVVGAYLAGMLAPLAIFLGIYALFGKAQLLLETSYTTLRLASSGVFGSLEFPIDRALIADPSLLFEHLKDDISRVFKFEFLIPPAVYFVAACVLVVRSVCRTWSPRTTMLLGLVSFGFTSFRVALGRADAHHLISVEAPLVFCLALLLADALAFKPRWRRRPVALGALVAIALLLATVLLDERGGGITHHVDLVLRKVEKVPSPADGAYKYPDLRRAGDVYLDPDIQALARLVRSRTTRREPILVLLPFTYGAEIYFLCNRHNPTRFDILAEVMTTAHQVELLKRLQRDPPRFVISGGKLDVSVLGLAVVAYLRTNWTLATQVGRYQVWERPGEE